MEISEKRERIVMSLGGSLVCPGDQVDVKFLSDFNTFIRKLIAENPRRQFFIVVGGGAIARRYRDAGKSVLGHELTNEDLDWIGIHATRLNAHLLRTIFRDLAHPFIIKHYEIIRKVSESVVIGAGWKPGWSTDYDAALLCEDYSVDTILNLSNIARCCDKDPNRYSDAKPIDKISWKEFRILTGSDWIPGMNVPFDPVAAKKSEELGLKVVVLKGNDWKNMEKYFNGEQYVGTIIE